MTLQLSFRWLKSIFLIFVEILTRLEDEVITDEKWEIKIYHVWTVPKAGKVGYSLLYFQKGGLVYKSSVNCVFGKCGDSDVTFLSKVNKYIEGFIILSFS